MSLLPPDNLTTSDDFLWSRWETTPMKVTDKDSDDMLLVHDLPDEKCDGWPIVCKVRGTVDPRELYCGVHGDSVERPLDQEACYSFVLGPSPVPERFLSFVSFTNGLSHLKRHSSYEATLSTFKIKDEDVDRLCFFLPMVDAAGMPAPLFVYDHHGMVIPREHVNECIAGVDVDVSFLLLLDQIPARPSSWAVFGILNRVQIIDVWLESASRHTK
ncbi:hypothetical protein BDN72DRAFT_860496 [Pluteus cervinus]|uniref:Uncharacterized protein n=1 Tax=Pluteus cervinus TaxID=181527 RepID=A0ACD3AJG5_9AGAR|nr:hypothetical protein BDN72DRAFT_860496 [Pluteus cervinus]